MIRSIIKSPLILSLLFFIFSGFGCENIRSKQRQEIDSLIGRETKIHVETAEDKIIGATSHIVESDDKKITSVEETHKLTAALQQMIVFDPNSESLYPGALVQGSGLPNGMLIPVTTERTPVVVTISDFYQKGNLSMSRRVKNPSKATVTDAIQSILKQEVNSELPAAISFSSQQIYNMDQAFLKLNASYKWAVGSIGAGFSTTKDESFHKYLVEFIEKYFTISVAPPSSPTAFISHAADYKSLKPYLLADSTKGPNPLCYVSSVTYGRMLWLLIESSESSSDIEAALQASFGSLATSGKFDMSAKTKQILEQSSVQSLIIGGSKKDALNYLSGDKISGLSDFLKSGNLLIFSDPPRPISYQVSYLSDNSPARISSTTDYKITTNSIEPIPSPLISATIHFANGDDGKDKSTGLKVYVYDNKTLGIDYLSALNRPNPTVTSEIASTMLADNNDQGMQFPDNSSIDLSLALKTPTNTTLLKDGVLVVWMLPHGHDRWQFTPTLRLKFKNSQFNRDIPFEQTDINQNNGFKVYSFSMN